MTTNIYNMTDTWNAGGTTFAGIKINVTNTASAADSKLLDLQVGGTTRVAVHKDGYIQITPTVAPYYLVNVDGTRSIYTNSGTTINIGANTFDCINGALKFATDAGIGRASANLVEVNNGTLGTLAALRVATLRLSTPVTKTADFTVADTDSYIILNKGSAGVVTLPAAASYSGREISFTNIGGAFAWTSASANVVPRVGGTAAAAILAATDGAWCKLVSDGTNWINLQGTP
jgi:hypothetical protein